MPAPGRGQFEDVLNWDDDDLEDRVWDLIGQDLVTVANEQDSARFSFSGAVLVGTPATDLDPWGAQAAGWTDGWWSTVSRAAAYQARVTGGAADSVYRVGGVKFDGFANGVLQEAKGPG